MENHLYGSHGNGVTRERGQSYKQGFGAGLFWGGSGSGKFWLLVKENILEFFKIDYELSKIRCNTCIVPVYM